MLLSTYHLWLKANPGKLQPVYIGLFPVIEAVGANVFCLAFEASIMIHPVFNVALICQYNGSITTSTPIEVENESEYEVYNILC